MKHQQTVIVSKCLKPVSECGWESDPNHPTRSTYAQGVTHHNSTGHATITTQRPLPLEKDDDTP